MPCIARYVAAHLVRLFNLAAHCMRLFNLAAHCMRLFNLAAHCMRLFNLAAHCMRLFSVGAHCMRPSLDMPATRRRSQEGPDYTYLHCEGAILAARSWLEAGAPSSSAVTTNPLCRGGIHPARRATPGVAPTKNGRMQCAPTLIASTPR